MKLGILREGKNPPDKRVPLTPQQCAEVQKDFPDVKVVVQPSTIRSFSDAEYEKEGIELREDLSDCDVLIGVKEVEIEDLLEGKTYLFFSHTIKKQAYNRGLLQAILKKNIQLVDYETLTGKDGFRIIGFGRFAGLVGGYSGIRAFGLRMQLFELKPAHQCNDLREMLDQLQTVKLPAIKIAVTGDGRVASGVLEIMDAMNIKRLTTKDYIASSNIETAVYTQLIPQHYAKRKDGQPFDLLHFFNHPELYENVFQPYARTTDLLIAAAFWDPKAPVLFTLEEMRADNFNISVISDITCDIEGSIPSTKRAATIDDPFYDYNPRTGELEAAFSSPLNITVQAVDNLPCELPRDSSVDFGRNLIDKVFPSLFGNDPDGIIERASITKNGRLTDKYSYLRDFAAGKE